MRDVFERMRPELVTFRAEDGRELFDLPDAPRPPAETPAPPRFLADYDNVLLGHADRSRFVSDEMRRQLIHEIGMYSYGSVLIDGTVAAIWRIERDGDSATLGIKRVRPIPTTDGRAMAEEGERLLDFWARDSTVRVRVVDAEVRVADADAR